MARGHIHLPKSTRVIYSKSEILRSLSQLDQDSNARTRVLSMETHFRKMIQGHISTLTNSVGRFSAYKTNPLVLLMYCLKNQYSEVSEIEGDILPAKLFSSMETSAGKMAELVTFPVYDWEIATSKMHTSDSALDGKKLEGNVLKLATLKSGPRCLNDEMSENFADAIINNAEKWASDHNLDRIDFTYGVLYGTQSQSNKKDWHILRNLMEKLPSASFITTPENRWYCCFKINNTTITATIRIGEEWWRYLGGNLRLLEFLTAAIRATVIPGNKDSLGHKYAINDLEDIVNLKNVPEEYNVSILQKSQISWLFLMLVHYCDQLIDN